MTEFDSAPDVSNTENGLCNISWEEQGMEITDIRIRRVAAEGKLKAYVTVTFDDSFVVHNVKVIEGKSGVFIAMPSRRTKTGEYKDIAHPINSDFRAELQQMILDRYAELPHDSEVLHPDELED